MKIIILALALILTASLCPFWASAQPIGGSNKCSNLFRDSLTWSKNAAEIKLIRQNWSPRHFTDPRKHNPENFTYLVKVVRWKDTIEESVDSALRLSEMKVMSASVISESHTSLFLGMDSGLILQAPSINILYSSAIDFIYAKIPDTAGVETIGLHTPEALVAAGIKNKTWNEVRLAGTVGTAATKVAGIFYSPYSNNQKTRKNPEMDFLVKLAAALKVPLIAIDIDHSLNLEIMQMAQ
jgi:hypothetical protein